LTSLLLLLLVVSLFYRPASLYHPQRNEHAPYTISTQHSFINYVLAPALEQNYADPIQKRNTARNNNKKLLQRFG
jgi:hypothetical protein